MDLMVDIPVVEQITEVPEYFVNGIAKIEEVCGNLRITLFAYTSSNANQVDAPRKAKVAIVMPTSAVSRAAMQSAAAAEELCAKELLH